jgi:NADH dehydrogenase
MENSTVMVAGASGLLGNEICRQLRAKNKSVRALVRTTTDPVKIEQLTKLGVQVVQGDIRNKETLLNVLQGVATVISTVSSMPSSYLPGENNIQKVDLEGIINLIDSSKSAGVQHFIFTSFSKHIDFDFPLRNAKRSVEQYLKKSGMGYTILRPSFFMELWLSPATGFDALNGKVNICGTGTNPVAYISYKDVAKFAVECISNLSSKNVALELGGPQNISQLDVVKIFEEVLHSKIEVQYIPLDGLQAQLKSVADPMQKSFSGLMICVANGDPINMNEILQSFPIKLTSVREYIQSIVPAS